MAASHYRRALCIHARTAPAVRCLAAGARVSRADSVSSGVALYLEVRSFTWVVGVLPKRATAGLALNNNPRLLASLSFSFPPLVEGAPAGADGLTQRLETADLRQLCTSGPADIGAG